MPANAMKPCRIHHNWLKRLKYGALIAAMYFLLHPLFAVGGELSEYQVKAGFILNIIRFTEWPAAELAKSREIKICTLGSEPFRNAFDALKGKSVKGKSIAVSHLEQIEDLEGCQVLFIGESERRQMSRILKHVRNTPMLTISELDNFTEAGGMINLLIERNKPVLEVNNASLRKSNLAISAQVLKLARKVTE